MRSNHTENGSKIDQNTRYTCNSWWAATIWSVDAAFEWVCWCCWCSCDVWWWFIGGLLLGWCWLLQMGELQWLGECGECGPKDCTPHGDEYSAVPLYGLGGQLGKGALTKSLWSASRRLSLGEGTLKLICVKTINWCFDLKLYMVPIRCALVGLIMTRLV